jgi:hypothetical protein
MMLNVDDELTICQSCTRTHLKELVQDLRKGFATRYDALCLAEIDGGITCEYCGNWVSAYWDSYEEWISTKFNLTKPN